MCGHFHGTTKSDLLPEGAHLKQFQNEYNKHNFKEYPIVCIYNAGSLLSREEVRNYDFSEILKIVESNKDIKHLIIESRPEFVTEETMDVLKRILKSTSVEIGIGLESCSDTIRDLCVNKGYSFDDYKRAAQIIKQYNFKLLTYLTVKPLFLTINESIADVVASLEQIRGITDVVSLEPTSIQKWTLVDFFFSEGIYRIPSGWILRDIILNMKDKINNLGFELRIGGFEFYPTPQLYISNCFRCNGALYDAINEFNVHKTIDNIVNLKCDCTKTYEMEKFTEQALSKETSIQSRISEMLADKLLQNYRMKYPYNNKASTEGITTDQKNEITAQDVSELYVCNL